VSKHPELCPGGGVVVIRPDQVPPSPVIQYVGWDYYFTDRRKIKRIRMTCPVCKRRVLSSISLGHDEDYIRHELPPHKPKHWLKRKETKHRRHRA